MVFKYTITGWGWAQLDIEINKFKPNPHYRDKLSFGSSLKDLLKQIISILNYDDSIPIDYVSNNKKSNSIDWTIHDEATEVNFIFGVNGDKANLKVIQKTSYIPYKEECVFTGEINFMEFIKEVIRSCEDILSKYGIIGFYANTLSGTEFPMAYYLLLKNYFDKKLDKIKTLNGKLLSDENDESDIFFTKFDQELRILEKGGRII